MALDGMFWIRIAAMVAGVGALEWRRQRRAARAAAASATPAESAISAVPDPPQPFGYKTLWFALRAPSTSAVAEALRLEDAAPANWRSGLEASRAGLVFVSPLVRGWAFVVSDSLPQLDGGESGARCRESLAALSQRFGEAFYFGTHRIVEYHAWARSENGEMRRAFAYLGEAGELLLDEGQPTHEERAAEAVFDAELVEQGGAPDEESVLAVASRWTIDPRELASAGGEPALGLVGRL